MALALNGQSWNPNGTNTTSGSLLLKAVNNDAGDLIFQKNTGGQLGRIWTNTDGSSGLFLSSGDNIPDLSISYLGNVGIGTTNPLEKFQIGNGFTFHDGGHKVISFNYAPSGGVDLNNTQYAGAIRFDPVQGNLRFDTSSSVTNAATTRMYISKEGNVGIGSFAAISKLRVQGIHSLARFKTDDDGYFEIQATRASSNSLGTSLKLSSQNHIILDPNAYGSTGNVGIGTTDPKEKLSVEGTVLCKEVIVVNDISNPAPDYVFQKYYTGASQLKDDYTMPTLEEVEAYTKANHHLPEVPSAQTIQEDGVQLKEMSMLLLQKVEELTLYTIEQEKRIKALEAQLAAKE
ncbi:hypothetical protein MHTCC0001_20440 [Flavobacteriaceae bacterium MHTCC 0001]